MDKIETLEYRRDLMIQCSEKCYHENDGLCTLKEVTNSSTTPIKNCPYYEDKDKKSTLTNNIVPPPIH